MLKYWPCLLMGVVQLGLSSAHTITLGTLQLHLWSTSLYALVRGVFRTFKRVSKEGYECSIKVV